MMYYLAILISIVVPDFFCTTINIKTFILLIIHASTSSCKLNQDEIYLSEF
ncbi:MAG: hypothetical protein ucyna2_00230 [Candidatus Atelocyanobacterium thalassa isolate SIO64986]|uniref:Uncharacterized protein n=1 Tax=Candidatus Atelocyanobacterium thalassa isolate SIO64986 TaxID=1527444 RepID=A0A086CI37_9CHRO|nr:MAG: hypothetical protein ucyna2_00230 [Candidatus Atelocyanobacterium thalassa isolate SIO64986]